MLPNRRQVNIRCGATTPLRGGRKSRRTTADNVNIRCGATTPLRGHPQGDAPTIRRKGDLHLVYSRGGACPRPRPGALIGFDLTHTGRNKTYPHSFAQDIVLDDGIVEQRFGDVTHFLFAQTLIEDIPATGFYML